MTHLLRYHGALAQTMASYRAALLPYEADCLGISHENTPITSFAQSFPHFPELPTEIRLQIWRHSLSGPRAVEVDYGHGSEFLYSGYPPPIKLHICRESRIEALEHYELAFDSRPNACRIYFNLSRDGLHFRYGDTFSIFPPEEMLRKIRNDLVRVRFISCCLHGTGVFPMSYLPRLRAFESLEEITLLIPPGGHDGPDRIFVDPSAVTLSPTCNFRAIEFLAQDRN